MDPKASSYLKWNLEPTRLYPAWALPLLSRHLGPFSFWLTKLEPHWPSNGLSFFLPLSTLAAGAAAYSAYSLAFCSSSFRSHFTFYWGFFWSSNQNHTHSHFIQLLVIFPLQHLFTAWNYFIWLLVLIPPQHEVHESRALVCVVHCNSSGSWSRAWHITMTS